MAKVTIEVELKNNDSEKDIQAIVNNYYFTSDGIRYLDNEFKKPVSLAKAACSRFLKKK